METRARYILVGAFTLFGLLAALGFILWLAKVQVDRTYAQYDILFDTVAGLSPAAVVRYNGIDVGKVQTIAFDEENPALVRVRIEVYASTPIRVDTMATLSSQGVTGVAFIALEGTRPDSDRLTVIPPNDVPVIPSKPSLVQGLISDAPDLLAEAISLLREVRAFTTPENRAAIAGIIKNVEDATARIDSIANRTDSVMASAQATMARADAALAGAEAAFASVNAVVKADVPRLVDRADSALASAESAFAKVDNVVETDIPQVVDRLKSAVDAIGQAAATAETFTRNGLPQFTALAQDARGLVTSLAALTERVSRDPGRFLLGNQAPAYRR